MGGGIGGGAYLLTGAAAAPHVQRRVALHHDDAVVVGPPPHAGRGVLVHVGADLHVLDVCGPEDSGTAGQNRRSPSGSGTEPDRTGGKMARRRQREGRRDLVLCRCCATGRG